MAGLADLPGRVAVVTGGASGIGRAMAACFAREGMQVVIADIEQRALDATAAELGVVGVQADVSDAPSVQALADGVVERFGRVDLLCNNAGVGGGGPIASATLKDWSWVIGVNLWGVVHGLRSFLPHLLANPAGGHVVNTASMAGLFAPPGIGPYNATKYAVVGISETLATELEGGPVGVSVLCPGLVRTAIFTSQRNRPAALTDPNPRRIGRGVSDEALAESGLDPEDVAERVLGAVREGRFWIITHPELLDAVDGRHRRLLAEGGAGGG